MKTALFLSEYDLSTVYYLCSYYMDNADLDFQEWLNKCPLVVTDYQDYTNEFVITFNLEAD